MSISASIKKISLQAAHSTFNGEVTYEVPCFHEYLSITQYQYAVLPRPSMVSHLFKMGWASGQFEIKNESGDLASVMVKIVDLNWKFSQWLWKFDCIISIADDIKKLCSVAYNRKGLRVRNSQTSVSSGIAEVLGFSRNEFLTAAVKAHGKGITLRILLKYQAIGYCQLEPEYSDMPKCPGGICGNPELLEALHRGTESDFIISCECHEFPVHRSVLKWASPVFRRMMKTPMTEASSNKLVITDVDSKVVQMMIDFIYKAQIDVVPDNQAVSLLYCAEKYELVALKENCLKFMMTILSETNVTEFLSCAIKCNAEEFIIKELVDYCKRRFMELSQRDEFRAFVEANLGVFYEGKNKRLV